MKIQNLGFKVKRIYLSLVLTMFAFSGTSCEAKKIEPQISNPELVYLKVVNAIPSSFDGTPDWAPKPDPMAPVDGDLETRWSSDYNDNEWIYFDFGRPKTISKIIIRWEQAYATDYEISISGNAKNWKGIISLEGQTGGVNEIDLKPIATRYVKLLGLKRANPAWGISIWEFEVYGPKDKNPGEVPREEVFKKVKEEKTELKKKLDDISIAPGGIVLSPGPIKKDEFQRGVNYTSWDKDELGTEMSDLSLVYLNQVGVGHIALMVVYYQDDAGAKVIYADEKKTVSDESLAHAINTVHKLGMKVMLKPHIDLADGDARTNILPSEEWFKNYKEFILHYAELASKYNVELFCIGTELSNTTASKWQDRWLEMINEVRKVYKGPLIYAANWDEYEGVSFWKDLDLIGMDAYFPLTNKNNPPKEELMKAWEGHADTIEKWLKDNGLSQGVIFTEIGYDTIEGSNRQPWRVLPTLATYVESQEEQANCLESLLVVLSKRSWFKGLYWWNYFPRPDIGPLGYTLRGKLGEKVLREWYKRLK